MWLRVVLLAFLAEKTQAFVPAPIRWGGVPSRRFVLGISGEASMLKKTVVTPQALTISDQLGSVPPDEIPHFTAKSDHTITWDAMGLCVEASGDANGDIVRLNHCTGSPNQLWNLVPRGFGRETQFQLQGSGKCMRVNWKKGQLNSAPVKLWECGNKESEVWSFEEPVPLQIQSAPQQYVFSAHNVMILCMAIAALAAWSFSAWFRRCRPQAPLMAVDASVSPEDFGGVSLIEHQDIAPVLKPCLERRVHQQVSAVLAISPTAKEDVQTVLVCTSKACKKGGSMDTFKGLRVLAATSEEAPGAGQMPAAELQAAFAAKAVDTCGCLGGCGRGPNCVIDECEDTTGVVYGVYEAWTLEELLENAGVHVPPAATKAWRQRMSAINALRCNKPKDALAYVTAALNEAGSLKNRAAHLLAHLLELRGDIHDVLFDGKGDADRARADQVRQLPVVPSK